MVLKSRRWGKILLSGGLLLILAQGVFQLSRVGSRLQTEIFWEAKLRLVQRSCLGMEKKLDDLAYALDSLEFALRSKLTPDQASAIRRLLLGLPQGLESLPRVMDQLFTAAFWETKLSLTKREWFNIERNLIYQEATLDVLDRTLKPVPPHGATGPGQTSFSRDLLLRHAQAIHRRFPGYKSRLAVLFQQLQMLEASQGKTR